MPTLDLRGQPRDADGQRGEPDMRHVLPGYRSDSLPANGATMPDTSDIGA